MDSSSRTRPPGSTAAGGTTKSDLAADLEDLFNRLVASSRQRVSTPDALDVSSRMRPLKLHPTPITDPESKSLRFFPTKVREIGGSPVAVLTAFRGLVAGHQPWPLFLSGEPGTGKTCAALALLDHCFSGEYVTCADLAERALAGIRGDGPGVRWVDHFGVHKRALVVLDELGTRKAVSDTHYECVQKMLDTREGYPLIVISNLPLDAVAALYDDRIASRCAAGTRVELKGRDRRTD
jgi:DNA replication protein DnaC